MTVDPRDLCTVADVHGLMQKKSSDTGQDALIQTLITRASIKIMRDYAREFVPGGTEQLPATAATRTFEYDRSEVYNGETLVDLSPYDLSASTDTIVVVTDTDRESPLTLLDSQFRPWPRPASNGVFMGIKISIVTMRGSYPWFTNRQIQITGDWGFPSIPYEVTQACAETVIHWITAYPAARRPDAVDATIATATPRSYPMTAVDLLCAFKRPVV